MTAAQHQLFNTLVQSAYESRMDLHEIAWILLGVLLLFGIFTLAAVGTWLLHGGLYSYLTAPGDRKVVEKWLREP